MGGLFINIEMSCVGFFLRRLFFFIIILGELVYVGGRGWGVRVGIE